MELEALKTISLKRLVGSQKPPEKGQTTWLAVVFGVCWSARNSSSDQGDYVKFDGDFIAKGLSEKPRKGEEAVTIAGRASDLRVPGIVEEMLIADGVGDEGTLTEFALKIGITADEKGRAKYVAEYIVKPTQASPAEALVSKAGGEWFGTAAKAAPAPAAAKTGKR